MKKAVTPKSGGVTRRRVIGLCRISLIGLCRINLIGPCRIHLIGLRTMHIICEDDTCHPHKNVAEIQGVAQV